ncbi:PepSY domain-containing protein [Sphingomonas sp. R647]|uniref:PepSY domain-containing protein n=1 Tax=Sphingomonas sp. R647 TaxID=2875233 RepID=UPI001CD273E0|nr:PepSY domain-containing protein [Sphingomonas sp. R647]MCA1197591.1 PepSY domain-containing protein [Sphingomonas sp. R647]
MKIFALAAAGAAVLVATPALADRAPTATEAAAIEKAVRAAGFVSWEEVELDDDGPYWEVDDARMADGKRYDLKLRPGTYEIVERELED